MTLRKKIGRQSIPESQVVNACMRWLWHHGCFVWRNNTGGFKVPNSKRVVRYGKPGSADIIGVTKSGKFIAVECKSKKGILSPHQIAFKTDIVLHKGIYILARSIDDLEIMKDVLV